MVCAYRARATKAAKPIINDPWAEALAGSDGHEIARLLDSRFPPMELWLTLRVAYLDRLVGLAVDRMNVRQVVILGAGYDTRAARLPRAGVRFFEVDHPATQAAKRERLARVAGYPIDAATYVTCNFEREDPIDRLGANGFATREPALVIWEGVVPYLTEPQRKAWNSVPKVRMVVIDAQIMGLPLQEFANEVEVEADVPVRNVRPVRAGKDASE